MKKAFFVACLIGAATSTANAQSQIATLSHEGEIKTFYGGNALIDAHESAVSGDVITLSAGSFNAVDFTKPITVRGAGMGIKVSENDSNYTAPTIILGDFNIDANADSASYFVLEGVINENEVTLSGVNNAQLIRCNLHDVFYSGGKRVFANTTLFNCYINGSLGTNGNTNTTLSATASYIRDFYGDYSKTNAFQFTNSIIDSNNMYNAYHSSFFNCILIQREASKTSLPPNSIAFNSLWVGGHKANPFNISSATAHSNYISPNDSVFVPGTFYQLTDEAKKYLGADGTEVGIYGGNVPFNPTPTIPQITKFNVASKTSADGKLSVDITVAQPE